MNQPEPFRSPSELQIQAEIYKTTWAQLPQIRRLLFHVPNESTYNNGQQASSGVIPGTPDLFLLWAGRCIPIELKDQNGRCSKIQKTLHSLYHRNGFTVFLFNDATECISFIRKIVEESYDLAFSAFSDRISPYADGSKYEEYLKDWQESKKARRK
jgi:hypothetical protein